MQLDIEISDEECYSIEFEDGKISFCHHTWSEGCGSVYLTIEEMEKVLAAAKAQRDRERKEAQEKRAAEKVERRAKAEKQRIKAEERAQRRMREISVGCRVDVLDANPVWLGVWEIKSINEDICVVEHTGQGYHADYPERKGETRTVQLKKID